MVKSLMALKAAERTAGKTWCENITLRLAIILRCGLFFPLSPALHILLCAHPGRRMTLISTRPSRTSGLHT